MISKEPPYKPQLGGFVYWLCGKAIIGGFVFGFDTSIISPSVMYLQMNDDMKPWSDAWKDAIFSVNLGMAALGALFSGFIADKYGRKKAIMLGDIINTIGAIISCAAFARWILLLGVFFLGIATGMSSHTVPLYISESCPSYLRGRFITSYQLAISLGVMVAYGVAGAFSYINSDYVGWRLMFLFAAIPSTLQFIGVWSLPQSPRFAFENEGIEACEKIFERIYDHNEDWICYEIAELQAAHKRAEINKALHGGSRAIFRVFSTPHIRKALFIGCCLQIFQQASGVNTINYFINTFIKSAGIENDQYSLFLAVGPSAVKTICIFIPMYLIEVKGRRMLLMYSIVGMVISNILMGASFLLINKYAANVIKINGPPTDGWTNVKTKDFDACNENSNCDFCVTDERCGFCSHEGDQAIQGFCLPVDPNHASLQSSTGYCNSPLDRDGLFHHINMTAGKASIDTKYSWDTNFCHSQYAALPIVIVVLYLCSFSIGFAPLPWVLNSEFYPFWARATCMALSTFSNWIVNLIVSLTYLSLSLAVTRYGLFFVYAGVTIIGLIFFVFMVPETKDVSIANVELLFMNKKDQKKYHVEMDKQPMDFLHETIERIKNF